MSWSECKLENGGAGVLQDGLHMNSSVSELFLSGLVSLPFATLFRALISCILLGNDMNGDGYKAICDALNPKQISTLDLSGI